MTWSQNYGNDLERLFPQLMIKNFWKTGNRHTQSGVLAAMEMAVKQIGIKRGTAQSGQGRPGAQGQRQRSVVRPRSEQSWRPGEATRAVPAQGIRGISYEHKYEHR